MRPGEVLGLRWEDVTLDGPDPSIAIRWTRGVVRREVLESSPKSKHSTRTLRLEALPSEVALLRRAQTAHKAQRLVAVGGTFHTCTTDPSCTVAGGHVVADMLGRPVHPENYSRLFGLMCEAAEVPVIRLHDARNTSVTLVLWLAGRRTSWRRGTATARTRRKGRTRTPWPQTSRARARSVSPCERLFAGGRRLRPLHLLWPWAFCAPPSGLEPETLRLTVGRGAVRRHAHTYIPAGQRPCTADGGHRRTPLDDAWLQPRLQPEC